MSDEFDKLYKDQSAAEESKQHPEDEAHISSDEEETEEEAHTRQLLEDLDNDDYEPDMPFFGNSTSLAHSNYNTVCLPQLHLHTMVDTNRDGYRVSKVL